KPVAQHDNDVLEGSIAVVRLGHAVDRRLGSLRAVLLDVDDKHLLAAGDAVRRYAPRFALVAEFPDHVSSRLRSAHHLRRGPGNDGREMYECRKWRDQAGTGTDGRGSP